MEESTPTGRELEILKVLWELGPAEVRQVRQRLCPNDELAFTTVQTLLRIMDEKGLVTHKIADGRSSMASTVQSGKGGFPLSPAGLRRSHRPGGREHARHCRHKPQNSNSWKKSLPRAAAGKSGKAERKRSREMTFTDVIFSWLVRSALLGLLILLVGSGAVLTLREPVRRLRIIELVLCACLLAPFLGMVPGYPQLPVAASEFRGGEAKGTDFCRPQSDRCPDRKLPAPTSFPAPGSRCTADARRSGGRRAAPPWIFGRGLSPRISPAWLFAIGWWLVGLVGLVRVLRTASPAPPRCGELLAEISAGRGNRVRLLTSKRLKQPFASVWGRATIVLPEDLCGDERHALVLGPRMGTRRPARLPRVALGGPGTGYCSSISRLYGGCGGNCDSARTFWPTHRPPAKLLKWRITPSFSPPWPRKENGGSGGPWFEYAFRQI